MALSRKKFRLGYTLDEYRKKIEAGEWQLHAFSEGFAVTEIKDFAEERICMVHIVGGKNSASWKREAHEQIKKFAKSNGCAAVEAICRIGMARLIAPLGWRVHRNLMRIDIA